MRGKLIAAGITGLVAGSLYATSFYVSDGPGQGWTLWWRIPYGPVHTIGLSKSVVPKSAEYPSITRTTVEITTRADPWLISIHPWSFSATAFWRLPYAGPGDNVRHWSLIGA